jgi:hypothetical protein
MNVGQVRAELAEYPDHWEVRTGHLREPVEEVTAEAESRSHLKESGGSTWVVLG